MFYWVIPYLLAINCTKPEPEWRNGPVNLFEAEVNAKFVSDTEADLHSNATMLFECRLNATHPTFLKCQVKNATLVNYLEDSNKTVVENDVEWYEEFGPVVFDIEFDKSGIKNLTFPEPRGYYREMVIRSIFNNLNSGIDLTEKGFDHYNTLDKTVFGECPTEVNVQKIAESIKDDQVFKTANISGQKFTILPFLTQFSDHQTILIEKERKINKCLNKKFYVFGSNEPSPFARKKGYIEEANMISSQNRIYLSPNGFNSVSEHSGSFRVGRKSEYSKNRDNNKIIVGKTFEKIRLTLQSVGPAESSKR